MPYIVPDYIHQPLYVVCAIYNPIRFKSRWKHYERFAAHVKASGAILITVEAAFGSRHHALRAGETEHSEPIYQLAPTKPTEYHKSRSTNPHQYITVRTNSEIWIKENLQNIGVSRLPEDWQFAAMVDADVAWARPNWVGETIHQLQHYKVVQMFSESQDVGPRYSSLNETKGFAWCYNREIPNEPPPFHYYYQKAAKKKGPDLWHPGYAWAFRRDAWDELGGLVDFGIAGSADKHMAHALVGRVDTSYHQDVSEAYKRRLHEWQFRADKHIRRNIGYVSGLLIHYWHGRKLDRGYRDRWQILTENKFNPDTDLKRDSQGVYQLVDRGDERSINLRDDLKKYFRQRQEDSIDLEGLPDAE